MLKKEKDNRMYGQTTLSFLIKNNNQVLLAYKKRGFGQGKWNGVGGKVEKGETPLGSAIREIKEEIGVEALSIKELGFIEFVWPEIKKDFNTICHIFLINDWSGQEKESEECRPSWFAFDQIPFDQMWDDDKYWYPDMLQGKILNRCFFFDENNKVIKFKNV